VCVFIVDLAVVDSLQSTAWDYACVRQLHYCMLIIASYLRQRNRISSDVCGTLAMENAVTSDVQCGSFGEDLDIKSLQVCCRNNNYWYTVGQESTLPGLCHNLIKY